MNTETPKNVTLTIVLSIIAMAWSGILITYTVFDGSATVESTIMLAFVAVIFLAVVGSMMRGRALSWQTTVFFFFLAASLHVVIYEFGMVESLTLLLPGFLIAFACGLLCNGYKARKWIWKNSY